MIVSNLCNEKPPQYPRSKSKNFIDFNDQKYFKISLSVLKGIKKSSLPQPEFSEIYRHGGYDVVFPWGVLRYLLGEDEDKSSVTLCKCHEPG